MATQKLVHGCSQQPKGSKSPAVHNVHVSKHNAADPCSEVGFWWNHYVGDRLVTKGHLMQDSTSMKCPEQANLQRWKAGEWQPGARGTGAWVTTSTGFLLRVVQDSKTDRSNGCIALSVNCMPKKV